MTLVDLHQRPTLGSYLRDLWGHRDFAYSLAVSKVRLDTSGRYLGLGWLLVSPLLLSTMYYFIFGVVFRTSRAVDNYVGFLVTGVLVFTFLIRAISAGSKSLTGNRPLMHTIRFPRMVLPIAFVVTESIGFAVSMVVALALALFSGTIDVARLPILALSLFLLLLFGIALGSMFALTTQAVLDVKDGLPFMTRLWFYGSGILYPSVFVEERAPALAGVLLFDINPGYLFPALIRWALGLGEGNEDPVVLVLSCLAWGTGMLVASVVLFVHREVSLGT